MILVYALRAFFILAVMAAGWTLVEAGDILPENRTVLFIGFLVLATGIVVFDMLLPRKSLTAISGLFFGLVVGLLISYGLSIILQLLADVYLPKTDSVQRATNAAEILLGVICCYLCVSFILQTKDDIRFVIPYVEFTKQVKGQRPLVLDTSVIIDGRIADLSETGILDYTLVIPRFVLQELQAVADSSDRLKRNRGRRGLDILNRLQSQKSAEIQILDGPEASAHSQESVDLRLVYLAKSLDCRLMTNDFNLNKVAQLHGVSVINLNDLARAVKPVALPGESMQVKIIRAGEEPNQGVGYLDDGTMVVVESARNLVGHEITFTVTSFYQTPAGRMIFGRCDGPIASARA